MALVQLKKITSLLSFIFKSIVAPPVCASCNDLLGFDDKILCGYCVASIVPIVSYQLSITDRYAISVFAISDYKPPLEKLILAKSYSNLIASRQLGHLLWKHTHVSTLDFDYIIPIPLHWTRYAKRGYNQAEEMAYKISRHSAKPVAHLLKRSKRTPFQSLLPFEKRTQNVADAFKIISENPMYVGKKFLIVDDVMTSGATLKAAVKQLRTLKPALITAVVACRVV